MKRPLAYSCSPVDRLAIHASLNPPFPFPPPPSRFPPRGLVYGGTRSASPQLTLTVALRTVLLYGSEIPAHEVQPFSPPSLPSNCWFPIPSIRQSLSLSPKNLPPRSNIAHERKAPALRARLPPSPRYPCAAPLRLGVLPSPASERSKPASAVDFSTRAGSPETKRKPPACSESEALACTVRRQSRGAERAK